MEQKEYKEHIKKIYLDSNAQIAMLPSTEMIRMASDIGFYFTVDQIIIRQETFPEEFEKISEAYFSVVKKLQEHYKSKQ